LTRKEVDPESFDRWEPDLSAELLREIGVLALLQTARRYDRPLGAT
jgi:hypothetical protein